MALNHEEAEKIAGFLLQIPKERRDWISNLLATSDIHATQNPKMALENMTGLILEIDSYEQKRGHRGKKPLTAEFTKVGHP